ncbi:MAG: thioredoxin domain-containing protein [Planctomycetota bacterium]
MQRSALIAVLLVASCRGGPARPAQEVTMQHDRPGPILPSPAEIAALPADGGPEFNRLVFSHSPYLLQHARNPVDWYPWGDEAFERARREDKPIFLSIGYATCHWCHVMEHESFEDEEVAKLLNEAFVCVKVDREERPDVDQTYMTVLQAVTGRGGWPMTIVLTPDLEPFFADTYLPRDSRQGRLGVTELAQRVPEAWRTNRAAIADGAGKLVERMRASASASLPGVADLALVEKGVAQLMEMYDPRNGGFGDAPKFPVPHNLSLLLQRGVERDDESLLDAVRTTLVAMRRGGVYDHVGFGFHRYSTDERWFLPHFEKMLYDQALLATAYTEGWQVLGDASFRETALEVLEYVARDLGTPEGGFTSAEDADSEGEEGLFYLWRPEEVRAVLGDEVGARVCSWFGVEEGGNFFEESTGRRTGESVLYLEHDLDPFVAERWPTWRAELFEARERRVHPLLDDKVLLDWNGLAIAAFARAGAAFGDPRLVDAASRAADFALRELRDPSDGRLLHRWRAGEAGVDGLLEDHAFLASGLLELYEATGDSVRLVAAGDVVDRALVRFWDDEQGGFTTAPKGTKHLVFASKEVHDGALPSGNSVMADVLLRLARITGESRYEDRARDLLAALAGLVERFPAGHSRFLLATRFAAGPTFEIVVAEGTDRAAYEDALARLRAAYRPHAVLVARPRGPLGDEVARAVPYSAEMRAEGAAPAIFLCSDFACRAPTEDVDAVLDALRLRKE